MEAAEDADPRGKRDPRDFALWKGWKKASEPETAAWPSPVGPGRPGLAHRVLRDGRASTSASAFDIHGGGVDLRFPHHENEQAQSRAAGHPFASYWLHNAWITTAGEKMSKSLGNSLLVPDVLERVRGIELRYYMVVGALPLARRVLASRRSTRRRPASAGSRASSSGAAEVARRGARPAACCAPSSSPRWTTTWARPAAVAAIHDVVREGNKLLAGGRVRRAARQRRVGARDARRARAGPGRPGVRRLRGLPRTASWRRPSTPSCAGCSTSATPARAARDYAAADAIRDRIKAAGIEIEDTPNGPKWTRLMAGNSQRKGAIKKTGKGNPTAGSGGRVKRGLEGEGPTPKAKDRPNHKVYKERNKAAEKAAARARSAGSPRAATPSGWPGATPSSRRCGRACR